MANTDLLYVAADELPDISFEFEGVDLAIYTSITFRMRRSDGKLITSSHVVDDGPGGLGHFPFVAGDMIEGAHRAEIRTVLLSNSKPETFPDDNPIRVIVRAQV